MKEVEKFLTPEECKKLMNKIKVQELEINWNYSDSLLGSCHPLTRVNFKIKLPNNIILEARNLIGEVRARKENEI